MCVSGASQQRVVETGPTDRVDAAIHRICTNTGIVSNGAVGGPKLEIHRNGRRRKIVVDASVAVTKDSIVAAHSLKLIERPHVADIQRAGQAETDGHIDIVELRAANDFDGSERLGT